MNSPSPRLPDLEGTGSAFSHADQHGLPRRSFIGGAAAAFGALLMSGWTQSAAASTPATVRKDPGTASGAPNLPPGFARTFTSRFVNVDGVRLHAVVGGEGPPLLLVHGWPETWYAWRLVMPALAKDFTVVAVDQRGMGLSDKPRGGYDAGTLARDLVKLMGALGHERFALVGHDTGFIISYALAADHPGRVARVALAEIPGPPIRMSSPILFVPEADNNRLWHIPFNRVNDPLIEQLVSGREEIFFGYEFAIQGGKKLPADIVSYYVRSFSNRDSLRGSFGLYRAWDATLDQNAQRASRKLTMPVLAIGGAASWGQLVGDVMQHLANDVQSVVIPDCGHWVAEQAPEALLAALTAFLAPYRVGAGASRDARPLAAAASAQ